MSRGIIMALVLMAGCFSPTYPENLACDNGWCPPGQTCDPSNICVGEVGQDEPDARPPPPDADERGPLQSISIGDDVSLEVAATHQFVVIGTYENEVVTITDFSVWNSTDNAIAWPDFNGLVTAASVGVVTITANFDGKVDDAVVTVTTP